MRDFLLLTRAPLAAGAVSNMVVGVALASGGRAELGEAWPALVSVACATVCLYWAGMVWNDVFDLPRDRDLHPQRPLPAGRISRGQATLLGAGLLAGGLVAAALAGYWRGATWRGLVGALLLSGAILGYDAGLKRFRWLGSLAMGSCRALNAPLGAWILWGPSALVVPWVWLHAVLLGLYVTGLTVLSTYEDEPATSGALLTGFGVSGLAALGILASLGLVQESPHPLMALGLLPLVGVLVRQLVLARREGSVAHGQARTRALLKGIWLFDLGYLLGAARWPWLVPLVILYGLGNFSARLLFRPPPAEKA